MSKGKQYRSRVMASVHETAEGLTSAGVMSKQTMREFDELCLTPVRPLTAEEFAICGSGKERARRSSPAI